MSEDTKIEWADMTYNPWRGCEKVSPGCKYCYAERQAKRNPAVLGQWGPGRISVRGKESYLALPRKWNALAEKGRFRQCAVCGKREFRKEHPMLDACSDPSCVPIGSTSSLPVRPRVFCLSFGDWLDEHVPIEWLAELLETIRTTPHLDWLLLTKRPGNFIGRLRKVFEESASSDPLSSFVMKWGAEGKAPRNVWVGTSVEDQIRADERIPLLLKIPAHRRFLSCEPLLGSVNLAGERLVHLNTPFAHPGSRRRPLIDWVIAGGESESKDKARPFALEWAWDLKMQCEAAGVPFFLKQLGTNPYVENANFWDWPGDDDLIYDELPSHLENGSFAGASVRLKHRKGGDPQEWPDQLLATRGFPQG